VILSACADQPSVEHQQATSSGTHPLRSPVDHLTAESGAQTSNPAPSIANNIAVNFTASNKAKKLNGIWTRCPNVLVNFKSTYKRGKKHLVFLSDGTWAMKDKLNGDKDEPVYAYADDDAAEPFLVRSLWYVMDDGNGFEEDTCGTVTEEFRDLPPEEPFSDEANHQVVAEGSRVATDVENSTSGTEYGSTQSAKR